MKTVVVVNRGVQIEQLQKLLTALKAEKTIRWVGPEGVYEFSGKKIEAQPEVETIYESNND